MESKGEPTVNKALNVITLLMLYPVWLSLYGIYSYQTSTSQLRMEFLYFVGYMGMFSILVFIPYFATLILKWRKVSVIKVVVSTLPFILMALMYWYAVLEGAPF